MVAAGGDRRAWGPQARGEKKGDQCALWTDRCIKLVVQIVSIQAHQMNGFFALGKVNTSEEQ